MKLLLIIISHNANNINFLNIYNNIINPLKKDDIEVDIASCFSLKNIKIDNKLVKYQFYYNGFQLSKVCYVINNINDEYDYYIKYRPEIILDTLITKTFLLKLNKNKINCRCRQYSGGPIDLQYGMSCQKICIRPGDIKYNKTNTIICPDDQMYIFHKNIKQAFSLIDSETYSNFCDYINYKKQYWVDEWMLNKEYWEKNVCEREGHHKFIWYSRGFEINPISIKLKMKSLSSSHLLVK